MIHQNLSTLRKLMLLKGATGGSKAIEATATGNPLTFVTDLARPLKSLLIPFSPRQEGSGDPSPENIRPILPWDGLTVFGGGVNIFVLSSYDWNNTVSENPIYTLNADGSITVIRNDDRSWAAVAELTGLKKGKYVLQWTGIGTIRARYRSGSATMTSVDGALPFTIDDNNTSIIIKIFPGDYPATGNVQIACGEEAKPYEAPHITETDISFPSPVYGGTLDVVSGVLTVTLGLKHFTKDDSFSTPEAVVYGSGMRTYVSLPNGNRESYPTLYSDKLKPQKQSYPDEYGCSANVNNALLVGLPTTIDTKQKLNDWLDEIGGFDVVYPVTPQTVTLTPAQITALVGNNTIWSDADGSMTAVYLKKG